MMKTRGNRPVCGVDAACAVAAQHSFATAASRLPSQRRGVGGEQVAPRVRVHRRQDPVARSLLNPLAVADVTGEV